MPEHPAATLARTFTSIVGHQPSGVWSAPGRVNLIGEHTDYNRGLCLPIALPLRTYAAVSPRPDRRLRVRSTQVGASVEARTGASTGRTIDIGLDEIGPGRPAGWAAYVAGVLWALREAGHDVPGIDVVIDGRVPLGAGLSSSAAIECAVASAMSDLAGLDLLASASGRASLAAACVKAENVVAQAPTGGMDQSASLLCQEREALLLDCRSGQTRGVPFDLAGHGLVLLVTDTRASHALVDGQYAERRSSCEAAARILGVRSLREVDPSGLAGALSALPNDLLRRRVRHVVTEIDRVRGAVVALESDDVAQLGRLFDASHASLRHDFEVSCDELDVATAIARDHGALGARMTGGGFGGSCIAIVATEEVERVSSAIAQAFSDNGFGAPHGFSATASGAAGRDS